MKISKYLHSCLVFELDGFKLLIDPGKFSFAGGEVKTETFADVKSIIITHNHPDHLDVPILKEIVALSNATVLTNSEVAAQLNEAGMESVLIDDGVYHVGPFKIKAIPVAHEPLLDAPIPRMTGLLINDQVLHPVDSMADDLLAYRGVELLIMITMAPFANELRIAGFADKMQPKQVLPVHDGYAKDFFIEQRYKTYASHFEAQGIKFHPIYKAGDSITI